MSILTWLKRREVAGGAIFLIVAAGVIAGALGLRLGTAREMGPGFLPLCLGLLLAITALGVLLGGLRVSEPFPEFPTIRPLLALIAAFLLFAGLIEYLGLAISVFVAIIVSSLAVKTRAYVSILIYAAALSAFAVLLFVELLEMPMKVWP